METQDFEYSLFTPHRSERIAVSETSDVNETFKADSPLQMYFAETPGSSRR
jgi:hypothetical protein